MSAQSSLKEIPINAICVLVYTVSQKKMSLLFLGITLTDINRFWHFLAQTLLRKWAIKWCFIFPPHLSSASALPGETGNLEIASFHLNVACFFTKNTRNILQNHLVTPQPPLTVKATDGVHQIWPDMIQEAGTIPTVYYPEALCLQSLSLRRRCVKNGSCIYQAWKSQSINSIAGISYQLPQKYAIIASLQ